MDAAAVTVALTCLWGKVYEAPGFRTWNKKVARADGIPQAHKKDLRTLGKTATLLMMESECIGQGSQAVFALTKDKDGAVKVSAVFSITTFCGE